MAFFYLLKALDSAGGRGSDPPGADLLGRAGDGAGRRADASVCRRRSAHVQSRSRGVRARDHGSNRRRRADPSLRAAVRDGRRSSSIARAPRAARDRGLRARAGCPIRGTAGGNVRRRGLLQLSDAEAAQHLRRRDRGGARSARPRARARAGRRRALARRRAGQQPAQARRGATNLQPPRRVHADRIPGAAGRVACTRRGPTCISGRRSDHCRRCPRAIASATRTCRRRSGWPGSTQLENWTSETRAHARIDGRGVVGAARRSDPLTYPTRPSTSTTSTGSTRRTATRSSAARSAVAWTSRRCTSTSVPRCRSSATTPPRPNAEAAAQVVQLPGLCLPERPQRETRSEEDARTSWSERSGPEDFRRHD